jgi:peptide/nickel transport system permease protein
VLRITGSRLLQMIPVLFGVTLLAFIAVNVLPGNIIYVILGANYTKAAAAQLTQELHLNQPIIERYFEWAGQVVRGNLGESLITHQSVREAIFTAAPPTIELIIFAQVIAILLAVGVAFAAISSRTTWVDRFATGFSLFGNSIPAFVTALLLVILLSDHWHLVSAIGWVAPSQGGWGANIRAIILPSFCLAISIFPGYMRIFRREMQEQIENEEYVTLAKMKGIRQSRLILRHVARNSALGIITLIGLSTGLLIGGAVIIEQIFAMPGIGQLLLNGIEQRDSTMVEGCIVVIAIAIVLLNLLADLTYAMFDPRVRSDA